MIDGSFILLFILLIGIASYIFINAEFRKRKKVPKNKINEYRIDKGFKENEIEVYLVRWLVEDGDFVYPKSKICEMHLFEQGLPGHLVSKHNGVVEKLISDDNIGKKHPLKENDLMFVIIENPDEETVLRLKKKREKRKEKQLEEEKERQALFEKEANRLKLSAEKFKKEKQNLIKEEAIRQKLLSEKIEKQKALKEETVSALMKLGFNKKDSENKVNRALEKDNSIDTTEDLIKKALS